MPSSSGEGITEVIKKLKMINDEEKEKLMAELKSVNLSKYIGEAVSCICEADFCSDIQTVVEVCMVVTVRTSDLPGLMLSYYRKYA